MYNRHPLTDPMVWEAMRVGLGGNVFKCDRCGLATTHSSEQDDDSLPQGWRELRPNVHRCAVCPDAPRSFGDWHDYEACFKKRDKARKPIYDRYGILKKEIESCQLCDHEISWMSTSALCDTRQVFRTIKAQRYKKPKGAKEPFMTVTGYAQVFEQKCWGCGIALMTGAEPWAHVGFPVAICDDCYSKRNSSSPSEWTPVKVVTE